MDMAGFRTVTDWVFDVDNTLYPASCNLFAQVDLRMTRYVRELTGLGHDEARHLQKDLFRSHGTTLRGLMDARGIDPMEFLDFVHAIDYSPVAPQPDLVELIRALPGRKFILTNAHTAHADAVVERLGGTGLFDSVFDIAAADYTPKPERRTYEMCLELHGINPAQAIMFDDIAQNLMVPHELGMRTVQILAQEPAGGQRTDRDAHIHHVTGDLAQFLRLVRDGLAQVDPLRDRVALS